jgi:hypothetical protein
MIKYYMNTRDPCKGLDSRGRKPDSWSAYSHCTSTVLLCAPLYFHYTPLHFHCTPIVLREYGVSPFSPWLDFNIIEKIDLIYIFNLHKKKVPECKI